MGWLRPLWRSPRRRGPDLDAVLEQGFVALDLETTGLDPRADAVVAASAIPVLAAEVERIRGAGAQGWYADEETREITDAYQHLMRLGLVHQLEQIARGATPDNWINPARLSHVDGLLLRDALKTVTRLQAGIRERFMTDRLA